MQNSGMIRGDGLTLMRYGYLVKFRDIVQILLDYDMTGLTYEELGDEMEDRGRLREGVMIRTDIGIRLGLVKYDKKSLASRTVCLSEEAKRIYGSEDFNKYLLGASFLSSLKKDKEMVANVKRRYREKTRYIS